VPIVSPILAPTVVLALWSLVILAVNAAATS
jgi:hypothetical protein